MLQLPGAKRFLCTSGGEYLTQRGHLVIADRDEVDPEAGAVYRYRPA